MPPTSWPPRSRSRCPLASPRPRWDPWLAGALPHSTLGTLSDDSPISMPSWTESKAHLTPTEPPSTQGECVKAGGTVVRGPGAAAKQAGVPGALPLPGCRILAHQVTNLSLASSSEVQTLLPSPTEEERMLCT